MADDKWLELIVTLLTAGLAVTVSLVGIIFSWLRARIDKNEERFAAEVSELRQQLLDRMRSLGHEDRDIRAKIDGIYHLFVKDKIRKGSDK